MARSFSWYKLSDAYRLQRQYQRAVASGDALTAADFSSAGVSSSQFVGASSVFSVANASGIGLAQASGAASVLSVANASGVSTVIGNGATIFSVQAYSAGSAAVSGVSATLSTANANATGVGTSNAVGSALAGGSTEADALSSGTSEANTVGAVFVEAVLLASGVGTVAAETTSISASAAFSAGTSSAVAIGEGGPIVSAKRRTTSKLGRKLARQRIILEEIDEDEEILTMVASMIAVIEPNRLNGVHYGR